jgi:GDPmannose 4,6-dehydratase
MLQQDHPDDYVIGTGESHSVRDFAAAAFRHVGLDWQKYVDVDDSLLRPAEVDILQANASKARAELGWRPALTFEGLVQLMVDSDLRAEARNAL